jgi:predicted Zn-dependent protease
MESMDKISGLKEILALDPDNSFARYGLALELASHGDSAAALAEFDALLGKNPGYTPGYFMAAQTLAEAGKKQEAISRLNAGIVHARQDGNDHAVSKMQALLDELER